MDKYGAPLCADPERMWAERKDLPVTQAKLNYMATGQELEAEGKSRKLYCKACCCSIEPGQCYVVVGVPVDMPGFRVFVHSQCWAHAEKESRGKLVQVKTRLDAINNSFELWGWLAGIGIDDNLLRALILEQLEMCG